MPFRPGVDDDEELARLIEVWRDGAGDIASRLQAVNERLVRSVATSGSSARNLTVRLRAEADRLDGLGDVAGAIIDDLEDETEDWIRRGGMHRTYEAGGRRLDQLLPFEWLLPHRQAVDVLAKDTFADVLKSTRYIRVDTKRAVRDIGRRLVGFALTGGESATGGSRRLQRELAPLFGQAGTVRYANGARHPISSYSTMLFRTATARAYNAGTLNQGRLAGVKFWEILDGSACGLTEHTDPMRANGLIVTADVANSWPLSHANCRRVLNPRPDVTQADVDGGSVRSDQSAPARLDQAQFEEALEQQTRDRAGRQRERRGGRQRGPGGAQGRERTDRGRQPRQSRRGGSTAVSRAPSPKPVDRRALAGHDIRKPPDWSQTVGGRTGEHFDVDVGPLDRSVGPKSPGPGVALVDDQGRLFYVERADALPDSRKAAVDRIERMRAANSRSLPDGIVGARSHLSVTTRSVDEAYWAGKYGRTITVAANADDIRVVHFGGEFAEQYAYHENGHVLAGTLSKRRYEVDVAPDLGAIEKVVFQRMKAEGTFPNQARMFELTDELVAEAKAKVPTDLIPSGSDPGPAWLKAQEDDKAHLTRMRKDGGLEELNGTVLPAGHGVSDSGVGRITNGTRPGVTDYAAENNAEDLAESWRLYVTSETGAGVVPRYKPDSIFMQGEDPGDGIAFRRNKVTDRLEPLTFRDLYPARAQYFDELLDLFGLPRLSPPGT